MMRQKPVPAEPATRSKGVVAARPKMVVPTAHDKLVQQNALSLASYSMPAVQRRLLWLAMAQVRDSDDTNEFWMPVSEVLRALGMTDNRYAEIEGAMDGIFSKNVVKFRPPNTTLAWVMFTWVTEAEYIEGKSRAGVLQDTVRIVLNPRILDYARTLQKAFHVFAIADVAKLQGRYSTRIFELVCTQAGQEGKNGNPPKQWFFQATVQEMREYFDMADHEYVNVAMLRQRVIDHSVMEINRAHIGLRIEIEYLRFGRSLTGFKFICTNTNSEPKPVKNPGPATQDEVYHHQRVERYPDLWRRCLEAAEAEQLDLDADPVAREHAVLTAAMKYLEDEVADKEKKEKMRKRSAPKG